MPAPANADEFLEFIRKSGVAEEPRLKNSLQRIAEQSGIPTDPSELAKLLMRDGVLTFFQADQLLQGKWKRFFIGKYKVLERLGSGGMGQVFLCEHKLMRRRVALKVLPAAKADDPSALERFHREARAVAALDHPNIVRAYDIDQDEKLHFLVMEYVDGSNLQELVKKIGVLDIERACHYIYGSAVGLQHAHEMGLVHRDIKPGNILIDRSGVVKILDMGLARFFNDEDDLLTKKYDENILGTADYLAPEQAIDSHTVDIRADIYSLGATFYFLLTGQPPFPEGSVAQKLLWHQTREPAPITSLRPNVPADLVELIRKMMAKDPAQRFQSPSELMTALTPWVQTPIPPPSDKEMPTLSPAIMTGMTGQHSAKFVGGASALPSSPLIPRPNPAVSPGSKPLLPGLPASPTPAVPAPKLVDTPNTPAPIPKSPSPPENPEPDLWKTIAEGLPTLPPASSDRSPRPTPPAERKVPISKPKGGKGLLLLLVAGFFLLGLVATSAVLGYIYWFSPWSGAPAVAYKVWYVSTNREKSPDPDRTLTTLRGAIDLASADDQIVILESRIEEPPFIFADSQGKKKGLKIEAGTPEKQVVWSPKSAVTSGARSALELIDVENMQLSGLVFELSNAIEVGVTLKGFCSGTTLDRMAVKNCKVAGFRLINVAGDVGRPFKIQHCQVVTESKIESGIQILSQARGVQLLDNRLDIPGGAALKIESPLRDVEFKNNRVINADYGVWISGRPAPEAAFTLAITQNTFHTIKIAGVYCDLPLKEPKQLITLTQNYFANTKSIMAAQPAVAGVKLIANGRDATSGEGQPPAQATPIETKFLSLATVEAEKFLRPAGGTIPHPSGVNLGVLEQKN